MPPDPQRLEQIMTMYARHDHQLQRVVRYRGSDDPEVVDDACAYAWMKLLVAEDVDLTPPRWRALAWLTTCAVRHARLLHARTRGDRHRSAESPGRLANPPPNGLPRLRAARPTAEEGEPCMRAVPEVSHQHGEHPFVCGCVDVPAARVALGAVGSPAGAGRWMLMWTGGRDGRARDEGLQERDVGFEGVTAFAGEAIPGAGAAASSALVDLDVARVLEDLHLL